MTTLEKFSYPEIATLEHQLEILLGEKKAPTHSQIPKEDRNKEEIDQLFSLLSSLSCADNLPGVVDRIHANDAKYSEMAEWAQQIEDTATFHLDFLA
jgi:hypothetical protein